MFYGNWFPAWTSKVSPIVTGICPINYFEQFTCNAANKRLSKQNGGANRFLLKTSYKGLAGIVDNERKYKGLFMPGTSAGSLWTGATNKPLKRFNDNFKVLSTDYENYAILY